MNDEIKTNFVGLRIPSEENLDLINASKNYGLSTSEYIRQAIKEKMQREDGDYLKKREQEILKELQLIKEQKNIMQQKKEESVNLTDMEIHFLIRAKNIVETNPVFLEGQLQKFLNEFGKPYKMSKDSFYKLMNEAENQYQEKKVLQEVEVKKSP